MALASSNRTAIRRIKEVTFGITPATPTLLDTRYTSESINFNISNIVSDEIRSDRQVSDLIQVQSDASGDLSMELSFSSYDDFIEGAMASVFSADLSISGTDITATTGTDLITSISTDFLAAGLVVGQWFEVGGFTNGLLNKHYKCIAVVALQVDVVAGSIPATEAAGNTVTLDGAMIRNGILESSFTIQKHIQDATVPTFINFNGVRVGGMTLNFATGAILTGTFGFMGLGAVVGTSQIAGAVITPVGSNKVMNAVNNVAQIFEDDTLTVSSFASLTINLTNNLRAQDAIGSLPHIGIALSRLEVTGDISIYFENETTYNKYINATQFSLAFLVQDSTSAAYMITLPAVKFESGTVVSGGLDQDVMLDASWRAIADPVTGSMIQIDRFVA
jgi:hypothetical protein